MNRKYQLKNSKEEWVYTDNKVGLSNVPNLTADINYKQYLNGEALVTFKFPDYEGKPKPTPPIRKERLERTSLTDSAKSKIKRVCRIFDYYVKSGISRSKKCSMITLSYPMHYPNDRFSKIHLDHFLKRMNRHATNFMYLWVAEKQKRGAIHFHIVTPNYIPKEIINKAWSEIVRKWYQKNNYEFKQVLPNVLSVNNASKYVTKYITKDENNSIEGNRYNISKLAQELSKPVITELIHSSSRNPSEVLNEIFSNLKIGVIEIDNSETKKENDPTTIFGYWIPNAKDVLHNLKLHPKVYEEMKLKKIGVQLTLLQPTLY